MYACGDNEYGQLGYTANNNANPDLTPMSNMPEGKKAINIACGYSHSIVLFSDGTVYGCGRNIYGQLGTTTNNKTNKANPNLTPMSNMPRDKKAINIACGNVHSIVLFDYGTVYGCGYNYYGQLGTTTNNTTLNPNPTLTPMSNMPARKKTINIACGAVHSIVLFDDGTVYGCGYNYYGQLGTTTNNETTRANPTLLHMQYQPNGTLINFNIASTAVFCVIFLDLLQINIQEKYNGTGIYNINLSPSTYNIYTYIPGQPKISIINSNVIFENKNIGTHKATINIIQIQDTTTNTNYVYVNSYITSDTITPAIVIPIFTSIPKEYDKTTNANVTYILNGIVNGETLSITYNANYISPNIGTNIEIDINNIEIINNEYSNNYELNNTYAIIYGEILNPLLQYINKYTNIKNLSKLEVIRIKNNSYAVIRNQNKLFSVLIE